jgi:hypothetical protein
MILAKGVDKGPLQRCKGRLGLVGVRVGSPQRLSRLLMAPSTTLWWLTLMGLPESAVLPARLPPYGEHLGTGEGHESGALAIGETWEPATV